MALPAAATAAIATVTQLGGRFMASKVGQFLFGSTLRTAATMFTAGHIVGNRASNAQAQVQQYRS